MTDDETASTISSIQLNQSTIVDRTSYADLVKSITNDQYVALGSLNATNEGIQKSIYGVIRYVAGNRLARQDVTIEDPTGSFSISLPKRSADFTIGNVIRVDDMVSSSNVLSYVNGTSGYHEIQTFEFDYSSSNESPAFVKSFDREMTRLLETFQANRLFNNSLVTLPNIPSGAKDYRDLCGEVVASREMRRSIVLSFWDGTIPSNDIYDPYKPEYSSSPIRVKFNERYSSCAKQKTAHINIWCNESGLRCDHFLTARTLLDDDNFLFVAVFNVEVSKKYDETELILRSGLHMGKTVRKVSKNSILGRMLSSRIDSNMYRIEEISEVGNNSWNHTTTVNFKRPVQLVQETPRAFEQPIQPVFQNVDNATSETTVVYSDTTEEVRALLSKLPSHLSVQTLKDMDVEDLNHFKEVIELTDEVEELKLDWSENLSKQEFTEIVKIIIDWKLAGCITGMIPDDVF